MPRSWLRLILVPCFLVSTFLIAPFTGGRLTPSFAAVAQASGTIPWHPHYAARMTANLNASVDLADGHLDLLAADLTVPGRGLDLALHHTWDSTLAVQGTTTAAGLGWGTEFTQSITSGAGFAVGGGSPDLGGRFTATLVDASQTSWVFQCIFEEYQAYATCDSPAGFPWQLIRDDTSVQLEQHHYLLTNILTGEVWEFPDGGTMYSDTDSYGNVNGYSPAQAPTTIANSGGRELTLAYQNNLLSDLQSPLWHSSGGQQGQQLTYGYSGQDLTSLTWGAGTGDQQTARFGYTGSLLTDVTTPMTQTWSIQYDASNRVTAITSPISGTVGQAGYTPSYTTEIQYNAGSTVVTAGYGSANPIVTTYTLDGVGRATAIADGLGDTQHFTYDQDNDVASYTDGDGNVTTNHYQYIGTSGSYGLLTEADEPAIHPRYPGNTLTAPKSYYVYDPTTNDLTEQYDTYGAYTFYTYDGHHSPTSMAQLTGSSVVGGTTSYHWRGQLWQYDPYGELTGAIDGRGTSVPDTTSLSTAPVVSANGQAASYTHSYGYSTAGDQTSSSTPSITTTTNGTTFTTGVVTTAYGYDGDGDRTSMLQPNPVPGGRDGHTYYTYDHLGRLSGAQDPQLTAYDNAQDYGNPAPTIAYDGDGNVAEQRNGNEDVIDTSYDPLGRLVSYTDAISGTTLLSYSATNLVSMQDPVGNATTYSYDAAGRRTKQRDAAGEEQDYTYDPANNLKSINYTDGTTSVSLDSRTYDPLNELATDSISGPGISGSLTTTYSYDLHGNLVREQHPNNDVTFNTYDPVDQLVAREIDRGNPNLPSGTHQETFAYDLAGNPQGHVDFRGATSTLSVDGDDRVTQQVDSYSGTPTITIALGYDPNGNRVLAKETIGSQAQAYITLYNLANWPTSVSDNNGAYLASYGGDGQGRQVVYNITTSPGVAIDTDPDNQGRWQTVSEGLRTGTPQYQSSFGYNGNDLPTSAGLPNGVQQGMQYDGASRLTKVTALGVPNLTSTYSYGYDAAGWTTSVGTSLNGGPTSTQTLTHDGAGRLTASTGASPTGSWVYDPHDNLSSATANGTTSSYSYSPTAANELTSVATSGQATVQYGYDGDGHTTSISNGGSINTQLVYDAKGRLSTVTLANGTVIAMGYNGQGQRASYTVTPKGAGQPSLSEHFLYQGGTLSQVATSGTSIPTAYTDSYVYRQDGTPLALIRVAGGTTSRYWYVLDGRKDVVALTDTSGNVVDSYSYDLWGVPTSVSESVPQRLRYAGYWYDQELGWYWLSVREYDPALERFLQPDPSEFEGLFSYVYAGDNPLDHIDPSGLETIQIANTPHTMDDDDNAAGVAEDKNEDHLAPDGVIGARTSQCASQDLMSSESQPGGENRGPNCRIEVRFTAATVSGVSLAGKNHAFILLLDSQTAMLEEATGNAGNFSVGFGGVHSDLTGQARTFTADDYARYEKDKGYVVQEQQPCAAYLAQFTQFMNKVNALGIPYALLNQNSNSYAYTALRYVSSTLRAANLYPPRNTPQGTGAPGWGNVLPCFPGNTGLECWELRVLGL